LEQMNFLETLICLNKKIADESIQLIAALHVSIRMEIAF